MPNWCANRLTVENATVEFYEYLKANGFSFNKIVPVEQVKQDTGLISAAQAIEENEQQIDLQVAAWSTKWDLDESEHFEVASQLIENDTVDFDTAWSPPIAVIEALSDMFPTVKFRLDYYEPGCWFAGTLFAVGGIGIDEECQDDESLKEFATETFGEEFISDEEEVDEDEKLIVNDITTFCLSCQENNLFDPEDEQ